MISLTKRWSMALQVSDFLVSVCCGHHLQNQIKKLLCLTTMLSTRDSNTESTWWTRPCIGINKTKSQPTPGGQHDKRNLHWHNMDRGIAEVYVPEHSKAGPVEWQLYLQAVKQMRHEETARKVSYTSCSCPWEKTDIFKLAQQHARELQS